MAVHEVSLCCRAKSPPTDIDCATSLSRFLSSPIGFTYLNRTNYIDREMDEWFQVRCHEARQCDNPI